MFIYSGKVKLCECGRETNITDLNGDSLFTGDILVIYSVDENGILGYMGGLTAMVSDDYFGYAGQVAELKEELETPFIMGLKSVVFDKGWNGWAVKRIKSHRDVIDGEKWSDYGFNYKSV